jgi:hypothetical protein
MTLMRTGTIDRSDFLGNRTYVMADGSTAPSLTFRIRSLRVGDHEVRNVTASITPVKGGLLLGQRLLAPVRLMVDRQSPGCAGARFVAMAKPMRMSMFRRPSSWPTHGLQRQ